MAGVLPFAPAIALVFLAACVSEPSRPAASARAVAGAPATIAEREAYSAAFGVPVRPATRSRPALYAVASVTPPPGRWDNFTTAGRGRPYPFEVTVNARAVVPGMNVVPFADFDSALAARIAAETAGPQDAMRFAMTVARSTFCRGGAVTPDTSAGRRFRDPAELQAILAATSAAGWRDTIPPGVRGEAIQPVEPYQNGWKVRLGCSLWRAPS